VLQEVLLRSPYAEVREVFANLLSTTFAITIKNEESYLGDHEQLADFECEQEAIDRFDIRNMRYQKSAALRLVKLFIEGMMDWARINWRSFNEFFNLLKDFAQSHFQVAAYFIHEGMIGILLEFVMNNKPPFYSSRGATHRMGDAVQQPDFQPAYELFSYLVKCCLTEGITQVSHYSPYSVFQEENKRIHLPRDHIMGFLTTECFSHELLATAHECSEGQNIAVEQVVVHLSWGDLQVS
jgi:hypothetical protein